MPGRATGFIALLCCVGLAQAADASLGKRPLTVADSIEATRVLYEFDYRKAIQISPDGQRYLIVLYRGDIERNGNWVEFFTGSTQTLQSAVKGETAARLFTTDYEITRFLKTPVWLADSERVAFAWNDGKQPSQVMVLNLKTRQLQALTQHPRNVEQFDISPDGSRVIYTTLERSPDMAPRFGADGLAQFNTMLSEGFAVPESAELVDLLNGYPDNLARGIFSYKLFVAGGGQREARQIAMDGYMLPPVKPRISPDGRWAVVLAPPARIPERWSSYKDATVRRDIALKIRYPEAVTGLRQLWLIDMKTAAARPLWDVPYVAPPTVTWTANSKRLVIGATVLPVGQPDFAIPVDAVELEIATGKFRKTTVPAATGHTSTHQAAIRVELREDENTPPSLVAVNAKTGEEATILDLNPRLRTDFTLGRVELVSWKDQQGRPWSGRLYYPVDFTPERRFPLVILTAPKGVTQPRQFSLRGPELTACTVSIAQPLANRNIAALVMSQPDDRKQARMATPEEGPIVVEGYESAIAHLVKAGLIARDRVGLAGYSRAGFYVQYALTHSQFPFRVAASADNVSESYWQYHLANASVRNEFERVNGSAPYGEGLAAWLERAPGFNADRIRAPLRIEINDGGLIGGLLSQWEIYNHLRMLGKPVELYVIPDIQHGSHGLVRPQQQLASLGGTTDWMDFWLTGNEDGDPAKASQYARWRKLRVLQESAAGIDGAVEPLSLRN